MDSRIERRINSNSARDKGKTGEGSKATGLYKRVEQARKQSGMQPRIRQTVDPRY